MAMEDLLGFGKKAKMARAETLKSAVENPIKTGETAEEPKQVEKNEADMRYVKDALQELANSLNTNDPDALNKFGNYIENLDTEGRSRVSAAFLELIGKKESTAE